MEALGNLLHAKQLVDIQFTLPFVLVVYVDNKAFLDIVPPSSIWIWIVNRDCCSSSFARLSNRLSDIKINLIFLQKASILRIAFRDGAVFPDSQRATVTAVTQSFLANSYWVKNILRRRRLNSFEKSIRFHLTKHTF